MQKTKRILNRTDMALLVVDAKRGLQETDKKLISFFREKEIPYLIVKNKSDLLEQVPEPKENEIYVSALTGVFPPCGSAPRREREWRTVKKKWARWFV